MRQALEQKTVRSWGYLDPDLEFFCIPRPFLVGKIILFYYYLL